MQPLFVQITWHTLAFQTFQQVFSEHQAFGVESNVLTERHLPCRMNSVRLVCYSLHPEHLGSTEEVKSFMYSVANLPNDHIFFRITTLYLLHDYILLRHWSVVDLSTPPLPSPNMSGFQLHHFLQDHWICFWRLLDFFLTWGCVITVESLKKFQLYKKLVGTTLTHILSLQIIR